MFQSIAYLCACLRHKLYQKPKQGVTMKTRISLKTLSLPSHYPLAKELIKRAKAQNQTLKHDLAQKDS